MGRLKYSIVTLTLAVMIILTIGAINLNESGTVFLYRINYIEESMVHPTDSVGINSINYYYEDYVKSETELRNSKSFLDELEKKIKLAQLEKIAQNNPIDNIDISGLNFDFVRKKFYNSTGIYVSPEELNELFKIVQAEAGGQPLAGMELVANVIFNRIKYHRSHSSGFADTVHDIIFSPGQFEPISNGRFNTAIPSNKVKLAIYNVLNGRDASMGALYFMNPEIASASGKAYQESKQFLFKVGNHYFSK